MTPTGRPDRVIRFGEFEADLNSGELFRNGLKIRLSEQPFRLLTVLLENRGELVGRDELRRVLWPEDTYVDFDRSLNAAASKLRDALKDTADNPRWIQTLPKRGYRFIAPLNDTTSAQVTSPVGGSRQAARMDRLRHPAWAVAAIVLAALLPIAYFRGGKSPATPRVTRTVRLTNDGFGKIPVLATDGPRIYFSAWKGGRGTLAQVAVTGGDTELIPTPFIGPEMNACLSGISPDGQQLLFGSSRERFRMDGYPVWTVGTTGHSGRRIGELIARDAAWSPDGRAIAYATYGQIWVADPDGTHARKLAATLYLADTPRWSPDGKEIRFDARAVDTFERTIWEVAAGGGPVHRLFPGWEREQWGGRWTSDGRYYVFNSDSNLWAVRETPSWGSRASTPFQLTSGPISYGEPLPGIDGRTLYAVGEMRRGELLRYDPERGEFVQMFPGLSADGLDYSRDGLWMAYITYPQGDLWRSRLDGSDRQQLTSPPMKALMPRWSPDGRHIVFSGKLPGQPWKAYLIGTSGGAPKLIAPGPNPDSSWFPDGQRLLVDSEKEPRSKLFVLDLKTGTLSPLPGSDGIASSQLSPDGRYVSGVRDMPNAATVLFDVKKQVWSEIAPPCYWHTWSRDSGSFTCLVDKGVAIGRFDVAAGAFRRIVALRDYGNTGNLASPWLGLAPDGSPLMLKDVGSQEIYALEWEAP